MKYLALSLTIVSAVSLGSLRVARANPMPVEGTRELRLGNSLGLTSVYGPGFATLSPEHGSNMTLVSVGVGMGYFVAEHVEVGGSLGYFYMSENSTTVQGPTLSAFLRLYWRVNMVGLFFEPTLEYQYASLTGGSYNILGPGADVGIEVFLADSWALRLSPTLRYYEEWPSADRGPNPPDTHYWKLGVTWGIAAYF
jgi:hypothetical protein